MRRFVLAAFLIPFAAIAEDIRFASGRTLKNATVLSIHPDGVVVQPSGFGAAAVKYPWSYLNPDDVPALKARGEKEAQRAAAFAKVKATEGDYTIVVSQVCKNGVLADVSIQRENYSLPAPEGQIQNELVFIRLGVTDGIFDGARFRRKLYFAGTYRYETIFGATKTVPALATSVEDALTAIRAQLSDKER